MLISFGIIQIVDRVFDLDTSQAKTALVLYQAAMRQVQALQALYLSCGLTPPATRALPEVR